MHRHVSPARLIAGTALILAALVLVFPPLPLAESRALALVLAAIGLWATSVIPEYVTALAFFTVAMIFQVAPPRVVFGAFESTALWLIFGGLVMGVAVRTTGLGERIAHSLARLFGDTYWGVITGVTLVGVALGFVMPSSMGRAVLLMPITLALAERFGFTAGSPGRTGVVLAAAFGCHVPTFSVLPANLPNLVLTGSSETLYHYVPTYGAYLLLHFPVLGFLKTAVMVPMIVWLWPDAPKQLEHRHATPLSRDERKLAVVLAVALGLWATDFVHHVSPAWVSMAAAVLLLWPGVGLVKGPAFNQQINYGSLFYVGGIMGLGALVGHSGLGTRLASGILSALPLAPGHDAANFAGLAAVSTLVGAITTLPGVPAVLTPLAADMARASGLPVESVLMSQVLGFSNPLFPYESAPLVVAMQLGGERLAAAQKLCLLLAVVTVIALLPLDYLWWRLLGWL